VTGQSKRGQNKKKERKKEIHEGVWGRWRFRILNFSIGMRLRKQPLLLP
jgi:hypothetical protein